MSSLVPGYMAVSWTVSLPAVGVRVTCGVEGRPEEGRGSGRMGAHISSTNPFPSLPEFVWQKPVPGHRDTTQYT